MDCFLTLPRRVLFVNVTFLNVNAFILASLNIVKPVNKYSQWNAARAPIEMPKFECCFSMAN